MRVLLFVAKWLKIHVERVGIRMSACFFVPAYVSACMHETRTGMCLFLASLMSEQRQHV